MIVYGSSISPFVRKVLAYGAEKGIALELKQVGLGSKDPDFLAASPFGKIPGFRHDDFTISDSTAIVTYLEALHPEPNLVPTAPKGRARTVWFEEYADTILTAAGGAIFFNRVSSRRSSSVAKVISRRPTRPRRKRCRRRSTTSRRCCPRPAGWWKTA